MEDEIWRLRRAVVQHPVHDWATRPVDRAILTVHKGFSQWSSAALAASIGLSRPGRHVATTRAALRRDGAGRSFETFLAGLDAGRSPAHAIADADAPAAARALVAVVRSLIEGGSHTARLGAFTLGLPCCLADQAVALDRLGPPDDEAARAARTVLVAKVALFDAALDTIRRRHMAMHPSAWRGAATAVGSVPPWMPMDFDAPSPRSSPNAVMPSYPQPG